MSFSLSSYTPRVFHEHPAMLQGGRVSAPAPEVAPTARLQPAAERSGSSAEPLTVVLPPNGMPPDVLPTDVLPPNVQPPNVQQRVVQPGEAQQAGRIWFSPDQPLELYVVALGSAAVLREQLAGLLDLAGRRRDVAISVGVATAAGVSWVLHRTVPYDVRAMPRYPAAGGPVDVLGALDQTRGQILRDSADRSRLKHRALVLAWDETPLACDAPVDLVVHCAPSSLGLVGALATPQVVVMANRPGARALTHCGRLFEGWQAFERVPSGVTISRLAAG